MKFNSDSAKMKFNSGCSKADLEQGFERVTDGTDPFGYANRNPKSQGWRDAPAEIKADDVFIGGED